MRTFKDIVYTIPEIYVNVNYTIFLLNQSIFHKCPIFWKIRGKYIALNISERVMHNCWFQRLSSFAQFQIWHISLSFILFLVQKTWLPYEIEHMNFDSKAKLQNMCDDDYWLKIKEAFQICSCAWPAPRYSEQFYIVGLIIKSN